MLNDLKIYLNKINDLIIDKNNTIFLDYPLYFNIGDLLIMHGTIQFFKENQINVKKYLCKENFSISKLRKVINHETTIFLQGGGNFGDLYPEHQNLRETVIKNFPNNRIIMLPQSVHFEKNQSLDKSKEVFNNHNDLYLLARDNMSLNILLKFSKKSLLMPDMAHYLYDELPKLTKINNSTLFFLRKDKESTDLQEDLINNQNISSIDWDDLITQQDIRVYKNITKKIKYFNFLEIQALDEKNFYLWERKSLELIKRSCEYFLQYDEIITSRLHAHILAYLLNIPSKIIDNHYKKNSLYYKQWTSSSTKHRLY